MDPIVERLIARAAAAELDDEDIQNVARLLGAVLKDEGAHWHVIGRHEAVMVPKSAPQWELVDWIRRCETGVA